MAYESGTGSAVGSAATGSTELRPLGSRYLLIERIGRGATGQVWRTQVRGTNQFVAAKILNEELTDDPDIVARFLRERSLLVGLESPYLARVRDLVVEGNTLAIVSDLAPGRDLRRMLDQLGTLPPALAVELTRQLLLGLERIHNAGLIHKDLKPENVVVDYENIDEPAVRITDFGIASLAFGSAETSLNDLIGSPEYLAPELAAQETATPSVDLYAVGIILYELVAGRTPFAGGHPMAVLRRQLEEQPTKPAEMPDELWPVARALLEKDPAQRPKSAAAVLRALDGIAAGAPLDVNVVPSSAPTDEGDTHIGLRRHVPDPPPPVPPSDRSRRWIVVGAVVAMVAVALIAGLVVGSGGGNDGPVLRFTAARVDQGEGRGVVRSFELRGEDLRVEVLVEDVPGANSRPPIFERIPSSVIASKDAINTDDGERQISLDDGFTIVFEHDQSAETQEFTYELDVRDPPKTRAELRRLGRAIEQASLDSLETDDTP